MINIINVSVGIFGEGGGVISVLNIWKIMKILGFL